MELTYQAQLLVERTTFTDNYLREFIEWVASGYDSYFLAKRCEFLSVTEVIDELIVLGYKTDHPAFKSAIVAGDNIGRDGERIKENYIRWKDGENKWLNFWINSTVQPQIKIPSVGFNDILNSIPQDYKMPARSWFLKKFDVRCLGKYRHDRVFLEILIEVFWEIGVTKGHPIYTLIASIANPNLMHNYTVDRLKNVRAELPRRRRLALERIYPTLVSVELEES